MNKVYLVNKEVGYTSQDYITLIKKKFHCNKIGHCGTLDPFADGLLIVFTNEATKIAKYIEAQDKCYIATLKLGIKTDTGDKTGQIVETKDTPNISINDINNCFNSFLGKQKQVPPMFSALKHNGERLYFLAHQGITVEREEREIFIHSLDLISFNNDEIVFKCHVSKGTYIRTLGEDIASKLGTVGHLTTLTRSAIGRFNIDNSYKLNDIDINSGLDIKDCVDMNVCNIDERYLSDIKNGKELQLDYQGDLILLVCNNKELAIYRYENNIYKCERGFN